MSLLEQTLGPIFLRDALGSARNGRYLLLRAGVGVGLLAIVLVVVATVDAPLPGQPGSVSAENARVASAIFRPVATALALSAVVVVPAMTIGLIADERQRGTLDRLPAQVHLDVRPEPTELRKPRLGVIVAVAEDERFELRGLRQHQQVFVGDADVDSPETRQFPELGGEKRTRAETTELKTGEPALAPHDLRILRIFGVASLHRQMPQPFAGGESAHQLGGRLGSVRWF